MKPDDINTYADLAKLEVLRLKELAAADTDLPAAASATTPKLLKALAEAYGLERPKPSSGKFQKFKKSVTAAKTERDEILGTPVAGRDRGRLKQARHKIKTLKRRMRRLAKAQ